MPRSRSLLFTGLLCCLLFTACNTQDAAEGQAQQPVETGMPPADSSNFTEPGQERKVAGEKQLYDVAQQWSTALNRRDYTSLLMLYASDVNLYGKVMSAEEVVQNKKEYLNKHKDFSQEITDVEVKQMNGTVAKTVFHKKVKEDNSINEYAAFLMLEITDGQWKIVAEGDNGKITRKENDKPKVVTEKDITSCDKAAEAIFLSSPEVKKLLAEAYTKYDMEYTPSSPKNPNKNYWFWIYAQVPASGNYETYARFQVDPATGQLYEYDLIDGSLKNVSFDSKLAKYIKQFCGSNG